jgi:CCR4-NOT transcription complex subunit 6
MGGPPSSAVSSNTGRGNESLSPFWQQQVRAAQVSAEASGPHAHARNDYQERRNQPNGKRDAAIQALAMLDPGAEGKSLAANGAAPHRAVAPAEPVANAAADDDESGRRRPDEAEAEARDEAQPWNELDFGGMGLLTVTPDVFAYSFITVLHLCHNSLTYIPSAVGNLVHLRHFDLSSNKLTAIPAEIGLLFALRELLVFDNRLTTLPGELGSLYQLEFLGIEGNPNLHHELRELVERGGTPQLISYLRDNAAMPSAPPEREWFHLDPELPMPATEDEMPPESFSVLCYNVLCDKYATESMYGYTPSWALAWDYRKEQIMRDLTKYPADIVCLQVRRSLVPTIRR